ncbi:uncharacterized protein LOC128549859 [Mercenaria mercenaria]|uniref:uncharacterized protein LOC128549859 n=1 Tax=Mercenaria mercenaria TaxID=6596 RepID=UPI00234E5068|nr:uncharacterized protein LOC128549859 [Mercenaria mercenaria]
MQQHVGYSVLWTRLNQCRTTKVYSWIDCLQSIKDYFFFIQVKGEFFLSLCKQLLSIRRNMMACLIMRCIYTILAVGCVCYGHETWTCTTNTDALVKNTCPKEMEEKIRALEVQVQQLQKLVKEQNTSVFTTIEGFPKGKIF